MAKTILKAYSTVESKLPTLPLEDGQLIFVYDKKKIILDNRGVRTVYEQIQTIETEEQRNDLLAPIDSFYFVIETSILWRYTNGHWNQITTSPQEQIDRIVAEGTKQVKAVRDEGQKVLQSIPEDFQTQMETKLNKQQGIENKGKVLVIGEDGNVSPGEVQSGGGDGIAIINTMSGESPLAIPDSAERVNKRLELGGKTEQVSTRGVNLWNKESKITFTATKQVVFDTPIPAGDYVVSANVATNDKDGAVCLMLFYYTDSGSKGANLTRAGRASAKITFTSDVKHVVLYAGQNANGSANDTATFADIQLEKGSTATAYEPYTGGKPSPSPEYPQEFVNVGKFNEGASRYEISIDKQGKNLISEEFENYAEGKVRSFTNLKKGSYIFSTGIAVNIYILKDGYNLTNGWVNTHKFEFTLETDAVIEVRLETKSPKIYSPMIRIATLSDVYEKSIKKISTIISSDRPLTHWDKLVERDGQIGWLYTSKIDNLDGQSHRIQIANKQGNVQHFAVLFDDVPNGNGNSDVYVNKYRAVNISYTKAEYGICCNWNSGVKYFSAPNESITTVDAFKAWLSKNPLTITYQTASVKFVPLPQSEQNAIRALKTYYPTTVITADGGELDPDIKVTYTADTKNYIDNKFGKTINAMQTKLLELESRV